MTNYMGSSSEKLGTGSYYSSIHGSTLRGDNGFSLLNNPCCSGGLWQPDPLRCVFVFSMWQSEHDVGFLCLQSLARSTVLASSDSLTTSHL